MERKCLETLEQFINMYIIIINDMIEVYKKILTLSYSTAVRVFNNIPLHV